MTKSDMRRLSMRPSKDEVYDVPVAALSLREQAKLLGPEERGILAAELAWGTLFAKGHNGSDFINKLAHMVASDEAEPGSERFSFFVHLLKLRFQHDQDDSAADDLVRRLMQRDDLPESVVDLLVACECGEVIAPSDYPKYKAVLTRRHYDTIAGWWAPSNATIHFVASHAQDITPARFNEFLARAVDTYLNYPEGDGRRNVDRVATLLSPVELGKQTANAAIIDRCFKESWQTARPVAAHPALSKELIAERLSEYAEEANPRNIDTAILSGLLANPSTPDKFLFYFVEIGDQEHWLSLARNPALPSELMTLLAGQGRNEVALELVKNQSTPGDHWNQLVQKLARSEGLRDYVGHNYVLDKRAEIDTLLLLCESMAKWRDLGKSPFSNNVSWFSDFMRTGMPGGYVVKFVDIVGRFKWGKDAMLQAMIEGNSERTHIPPAGLRAMETFSGGGSKVSLSMKLQLAKHVNTPDDILVKLARSSDEGLAGPAKSQLLRRPPNEITRAYFQKENKKR